MNCCIVALKAGSAGLTVDAGQESREQQASAFVVAIEDYERHPRLDGLSAPASELAAALVRGGFVDAMPSGRTGGTASQLAPQLKSWFEAATSEQRLLLFWTGYGELEGSRFWLMTRDSPTSKFDHITAVEPSFIAKKAAESKAKRILLVIDACHSGKVIGDVIAELSNVLGELAPSLTGGRGVAVIASAHAVELAKAGVVSRVLKDALTNASSLVDGLTPTASLMAISARLFSRNPCSWRADNPISDLAAP
jgi:hypothetical protein